MRSALIECLRSFVNLCLLPSELQIIVELLMAATAQYLKVPRVSHIFRMCDKSHPRPPHIAHRSPIVAFIRRSSALIAACLGDTFLIVLEVR